ncbi:UNVERIFIED_CONTAM: hypothetical protein Sindi_1827100 [Sesamum indicum]
MSEEESPPSSSGDLSFIDEGVKEGEDSSPGEEEREVSPSPREWGSSVLKLKSDLRFPILSFYSDVATLFWCPSKPVSPQLLQTFGQFLHDFLFSSVLFPLAFFLKRAETGWESSITLTSLLDILNNSPYDCRSLTNERLLDHFSLNPRVEPLEDSLENIMFSKLIRDHTLGFRTGGIPPSRSSRGTLFSSESRVKFAASPTHRATSIGSSKRAVKCSRSLSRQLRQTPFRTSSSTLS